MSSLILVTGSTGYIASRLIPQLLERGYRVRALARHPERLKARKWFSQVEMAQGDVMEIESLIRALDGVHTAYYLIHNMASGHGYTSLEIEGARYFAQAAEKAGVQHIIYLGGLADPEQHIAPHMRSHIETGATLREGTVPVTEFRAGVIAGSGSISFEMIRFMAELFPIIPGPTWLKNRSQPIATQNVIDYLLAALTNSNGRGGVYEVGVQKVYTYVELMKIYAEIRGHKRWFILLPFIPIWFMAFGIDLMTPVPRRMPMPTGIIEPQKIKERRKPASKSAPIPEGRASGINPAGRIHQRARLAASRIPKLETGLSETNAAAFNIKTRIRPITPNAPMRGSFMISSLRSLPALTNKPSQQSARPSRCKPPVNKTQMTSVRTPAANGGKRSIAPFHASHVNMPMTNPTDGYHTAARPLSPADQLSGSRSGSVVSNPKAVRKLRIFPQVKRIKHKGHDVHKGKSK